MVTQADGGVYMGRGTEPASSTARLPRCSPIIPEREPGKERLTPVREAVRGAHGLQMPLRTVLRRMPTTPAPGLQRALTVAKGVAAVLIPEGRLQMVIITTRAREPTGAAIHRKVHVREQAMASRGTTAAIAIAIPVRGAALPIPHRRGAVLRSASLHVAAIHRPIVLLPVAAHLIAHRPGVALLIVQEGACRPDLQADVVHGNFIS